MGEQIENNKSQAQDSSLLRTFIAYFLLIMNSLSILFGILILVGVNVGKISNLIGAIVFICFFGNIVLNNIAIQKKLYSNIIRHKEYLEIIIIYEIITFFAALFLGFGNFEQSMSYLDSEPIGAMGIVLRVPGYFIPFIFELYLVRKSFFPKKEEMNEQLGHSMVGEGALNKFLKMKKLRKAINILIKILNALVLAVGITFIVIIYSVAPYPMNMTYTKEILYGIFGIVIAPFAIFYAMAAFVNGYIAFKLNYRYKLRSKYNTIYSKFLYLCGIISIILSLMFISTIFAFPTTQARAEEEWDNVFGDEWAIAQNRSNFSSESKYFLDETCKLSQYFLPEFEENCIIYRDITYYHDTTGKDNNITLKYDVYVPKDYGEDLPGRNSTIIRIHGGAWMFGDKGYSNMLQFSKYLASQGYVIFDIEYGLYNTSESPLISDIFKSMPQPENRIGNFNLDDMLRFIGYFTQELADNAWKYNANLDSVFISGGSAGGNIACATALAMADPRYMDMFNTSMTIKGLIPYYPANDICRMEGLDHHEDFVDPKRMVKEDSVPCLLFQGTQDGLVNPRIAADFKDAYLDAGNENCAVIYEILAAHAFDVYYSGFYNQLLMYYTERFLYIYR